MSRLAVEAADYQLLPLARLYLPNKESRRRDR